MLILLSLASALAQDTTPVELAPLQNARYQATTIMDFELLKVDAEAQKPTGTMMLEPVRGVFNPFFRLRTDFNDELAGSVDEVK